MTQRASERALTLVAAFAGGVTLTTGTLAAAYEFDGIEAAYDQLYLATDITLIGRVVDEGGYPLKDAVISIVAWGENALNHGAATQVGSGGVFAISGLARRAGLLRVSMDGYYTELVPVDLAQPLSASSLDIGDIGLTMRLPGRARLTFAGDVMVARKFINADGDDVVGEPHDLVKPATATADTAALFRFITEILQNDDHTSVNLETAVTGAPVSPHPTKTHVFYTYPQSLHAFPLVGIDSLTLGNNHIYDYMEPGMSATLAAIEATGLPWYGAGVSETDARDNRYLDTLNGIPVALQGFNEMVGTQYEVPGLYGSEVHIVAEDTPTVKGGALALNELTVPEFLADESPTRFAVPVFHGGDEYVYRQTADMRADFRLAIEHGAGMVVAHHPHYVHGVSVYDAGEGPRFIFGSLGNFIFDQGFFETARSYIAMVDVDYSPSGPRVSRVRLIPLRFDDYTPRLLAGSGLARMGRFLGHLSTAEAEPGDGIVGATVFAQDGVILANFAGSGYVTSESVEHRTVAMSSGSTGVIAFEPLTESDSLAHVSAATSATCRVGRDILIIGDFEEEDADDAFHEADRWSQSSTRYVQNSVVRSGNGAAVILRASYSTGRSALSTDNTIRVPAGRPLTITGFVKGNNAGVFEVQVRQYNEIGTTIADTVMLQRAPGTYDWRRFTVNFTPQASTWGIKLYFAGNPPESGEAEIFLDDVALIEWDDRVYDAGTGFALATPNDWGYLRCSGSGSSLGLALEHRVYERTTTVPVYPTLPPAFRPKTRKLRR